MGIFEAAAGLYFILYLDHSMLVILQTVPEMCVFRFSRGGLEMNGKVGRPGS